VESEWRSDWESEWRVSGEWWGVADLSHLGLKPHVQHPVGLVPSTMYETRLRLVLPCCKWSTQAPRGRHHYLPPRCAGRTSAYMPADGTYQCAFMRREGERRDMCV